ncbi:MAG: prepilin peptidase [bacterium]|nr:prepilin peptidase [bacterium]
MNYIHLIFIAIIGLVFGSFLSVILFRPDGRGVLFGRSECRKCLTRLKWYDLFPIFSFLMLKGKCRYCGHKISSMYLVIELVTLSTFVPYCWLNGPCLGIESVYWLGVIFILLALSFFDYLYYILPDRIIGIGFIGAILYGLFPGSGGFSEGISTGLALAGFFCIIFIVSRGEWMGFGDVKLAGFIGFVLGFPLAVWSILLAIWIGALWGIGLLVTKKANLKTPLPFGTFMSITAILLIIFKKYVEYFSPIF